MITWLAVFGTALLLFLSWKGCGNTVKRDAYDKALQARDRAISDANTARATEAAYQDSLRHQKRLSDSLAFEREVAIEQVVRLEKGFSDQQRTINRLAGEINSRPVGSAPDPLKCDSLAREATSWATRYDNLKLDVQSVKHQYDLQLQGKDNEITLLASRFDLYKLFCDTTLKNLESVTLPKDRAELYAVAKIGGYRQQPLAQIGGGLGLRTPKGAWYQVTYNAISLFGPYVEIEYGRRLSFTKH